VKNLGRSSCGHSQGFPRDFRAPIHRAHCAVIIVTAQLYCFISYLKNWIYRLQSLQLEYVCSFVHLDEPDCEFDNLSSRVSYKYSNREVLCITEDTKDATFEFFP